MRFRNSVCVCLKFMSQQSLLSTTKQNVDTGVPCQCSFVDVFTAKGEVKDKDAD